MNADADPGRRDGRFERFIGLCIERRLVVFGVVLVLIGWGTIVAPFDWHIPALARDPVPVDAIPDIGENQQIVFSRWPGRSPQDIEDQVTYPLTVSLLGVPGVKTIRSFSMFGFSSIYVIFEEDVEFYWSRSRILERLSSLPAGTLPENVEPALGPDATALGQVYWYTLEGRDPAGNPTGGWDPQELRTIQDFQVRYALTSAQGVAEVASVGGFQKEYQVDVDPDAMRAYGVTLEDVFRAVRMSNADVGARTIEINRVEYVIRGVGLLKSIEDLERTVVKAVDGTPVFVRQVATVALGPQVRRGVLDKDGVEAVGGVVVVRYGANPLRAIENVKARIAEIAPGLPRRTLEDGTVSQVTVVPFYDRSELIHETLDTLGSALSEEILVTVLVVVIMILHVGSAFLVSAVLPLAVLMSFVAMRYTGVDANIVALSGIAIAIGTMVDMGIVVTENVLSHVRALGGAVTRDRIALAVRRGAGEVGGAVVTAVATTIVSFLPVFVMTGAEGKLFMPLAFTKTYALLASVIVAVVVIPPLAYLMFARSRAASSTEVRSSRLAPLRRIATTLGLLAVLMLLADHWEPVGPERGLLVNALFVALLLGGVLGVLLGFGRAYPRILGWCLDHRGRFSLVPITALLLGGLVWLGFDRLAGWLPRPVRTFAPVAALADAFPGLGREFMPPLDEGSYLFMPTMMPHASIGEATDALAKQDMLISTIPEVESAVGKIGRVESPLDPAPISMVETVVTYTPEYLEHANASRARYRFDADSLDLFRGVDGTPLMAPDGMPYRVRGAFLRDENGALVPDRRGRPFRLWRPEIDPSINVGRNPWRGIQEPDDIWDAIVDVSRMPGSTGAPRLQPIAARLVMLQSGMRAPMGIKIRGPDLETIQAFGFEIERVLETLPSVRPGTVNADRIVGKPYIEIHVDREAIARYGIHVQTVQDIVQTAIGGRAVTTTVEGRERFPVRVRYARERRDAMEAVAGILVAAPDGTQLPLGELAEVRYVRGPQVIKSEDTFLTGYVIFDRAQGRAEVDVVEDVRRELDERIASGDLVVPENVSYRFAGSYENQVRAQKTLAVILPLALMLIFLILYLQFGSVTTSALVFSGVGIAWAGGFLLIWLYGQSWFLDVSIGDLSLRDLFGIGPVNLSVAVWVGFLALFGVATDNGVVMGTYLEQSFLRRSPRTRAEIRTATIEAGTRRIRPCLMTTATTILALLPVLTSSGRGSDVMVPMAIPSVGGMAFVVLSTLTVPVAYAWVAERRARSHGA